jgi:hypothetical protein
MLTRQEALVIRRIELRRDIHYVLARDQKLKEMGMDMLMDAAWYDNELKEQKRIETQLRIESQLGIESQGSIELPSKNSFSSTLINFNTPSDTMKLETLLNTTSVEDIMKLFLEKWQPDDDLPAMPEFVEHDESLKDLGTEFDKAFVQFALDFLKTRADRITAKSLLGLMRTGMFQLTFERMFQQ